MPAGTTPRIGRFLAVDPAGFDPQNPQSFNRYAYANNNPYKYVDPVGRWAEMALDVISIGLSVDAFRNDPSLGNAWDSPTMPSRPPCRSSPGFGIIKNGANAAGAAGDAAKVAAKTPEKLYHYTGADLSMATEGLNPDGSGKVFTTPDGHLSPSPRRPCFTA